MNWFNDPVILFVIFESAILLPTIIMFIFLTRKGNCFQCPVCEEKVSRSYIRFSEIECPHCEWRIVHPSMLADDRQSVSADVQLRNQSCGSCGQSLETVEANRLWDGRSYCKACIVEQSPLLWDYAADHPILEEAAPYSVWSATWKMSLFSYLGMMATFGSIVFCAGYNEGGLLQGLTYLAWSQLFFIPFLGIFMGAFAAGRFLSKPQVSLENGALVIRHGMTAKAKHALTSCFWFYGDVSKGEELEYFRGPAILLAAPRGEGDQSQKYAAVGFTEEMRQIWSSFLTLADVRHRTEWECVRPWWWGVVSVFLVILALPVTAVSCYWLGRAVGLSIYWLTGDAWIGYIIQNQFVMPGVIYALLYLAALWPRSGPRTERTPKEIEKLERHFRNAIVMIFTFMASCLAVMRELGPLHARLMGAGVMVLTAVFVGRDLGRRFARL